MLSILSITKNIFFTIKYHCLSSIFNFNFLTVHFSDKTVINILFIALLTVYFFFYLFVHRKFSKEITVNFNEEFYPKTVNDYSPAVLSKILYGKIVKSKTFLAMIFYLYQKGYFDIEILNDDNELDFSLKKLDKDISPLTEHETFFIDWLINDLGDGEYFYIKKLKNIENNENIKRNFLLNYEEWENKINLFLINKNLVEQEDSKGVTIGKSIAVFYIFISTILLFKYNSYIYIITLVLGFLGFNYSSKISRRSEKGQEEYLKWMAHKRYLKASSNNLGIEEIKTLFPYSLILLSDEEIVYSIEQIDDIGDKGIDIHLNNKDYILIKNFIVIMKEYVKYIE